MQYVYGTVKRNGVEYDSVKTVGEEHTDLSGRVSITREYSDSNITDNFDVVEKYRSDESEGLCYDWYAIKNHYRYIDKFTPNIGATEQEITELEIESMEQAIALTDAEIAIMELEERIGESYGE